MYRLSAVFLVISLLATPAAARMEGCTKNEETTIKTSIAEAKRLVLTAAASVQDDDVFSRWFGKFSPAAGEVVRGNLKSIARAIRTGAVTARCARVSPQDCDPETYAYVFNDEAYLVNLCPRFFRQPTMSQLRPGTDRSDNGAKAGTIVHEISHFIVVARTEDHCYSRTECETMAQRDPTRARENADSYQYFVEDITYFANIEED